MKVNINRLLTVLEVALIFLIDIVSILITFKISMLARLKILPALYEGFPESLPFSSVFEVWWIVIIWLFFFYYEGLYTRRFAFWDEVYRICKVVFFSSVGVFAIASIGKLSGDISRTVVVLMGFAGILLVPIFRITMKSILRKTGLLKRRVLVLGAGDTGRLITEALRKEPNFGFEVVGYLDDDPLKVGAVIDGIKVHRGVDSASKYLRRCNITDLIVAMPGAGKERLQEIINRYQHQVNTLMFVPDLFGMAVVGTTLQHFFDEQAFAIEIKNNLAAPLNYFTKRAFEYVVGITLLVFLSIPILVISIMIRLTSEGPAIFRQERVGRKGKPFMCYKFRTMYIDADERLQEILSKDISARHEWDKYWKLHNEPRVTGIGKFLRSTSLDELPQILNVLKGEMSLVGPRPVTQYEIDNYYKEAASLCFSVLPGITGLWQVSGRSNTSYAYRIALDSWYVRNWNLWLDIVILLRTLKVVLYKEGAV